MIQKQIVLIKNSNFAFKKLLLLNGITFLALIINLITPFFTENTFTQSIFCALLIFSVGLLHGCTDIKDFFNEEFSSRQIGGLIIYIGLFVISALLLYTLPTLGIYVFIILSGYHFGQQDLNGHQFVGKNWIIIFKFSFGLSVLTMMLFTHIAAVNAFLTEYFATTLDIFNLQLIMIVALSIELVSGFFSMRKNSGLRVTFIGFQIALLLLYLFFQTSSLLWSFTFYFIFWHSLPSIRHQVSDTYGKINLNTLLAYVKSGFLWYSASIIGLLVLLYLNSSFKIDRLMASIVLAATVPHIVSHIRTLKPEGRLF